MIQAVILCKNYSSTHSLTSHRYMSVCLSGWCWIVQAACSWTPVAISDVAGCGMTRLALMIEALQDTCTRRRCTHCTCCCLPVHHFTSEHSLTSNWRSVVHTELVASTSPPRHLLVLDRHGVVESMLNNCPQLHKWVLNEITMSSWQMGRRGHYCPPN